MLTLRRWHSYIGLFIAPSVLFFALTGALQLFSLHEAHGTYHPLPIIEKLASVHKDQVFALDDHHAATPGPDAEGAKPGPDGAAGAAAGAGSPPGPEPDGDEPGVATLLLKYFFLLVALGLTASTTMGLWIGLKQMRRQRVAWLLVLAGIVTPLVLLIL